MGHEGYLSVPVGHEGYLSVPVGQEGYLSVDNALIEAAEAAVAIANAAKNAKVFFIMVIVCFV